MKSKSCSTLVRLNAPTTLSSTIMPPARRICEPFEANLSCLRSTCQQPCLLLPRRPRVSSIGDLELVINNPTITAMQPDLHLYDCRSSSASTLERISLLGKKLLCFLLRVNRVPMRKEASIQRSPDISNIDLGVDSRLNS